MGRTIGIGRVGAAVLVGCLASLAAGTARADHDMASMSENHHGDGSELSVGLSVEAASFSTSYVGSYEGVMPSLGWMSGSFGAAAKIGVYHLDKNGLSSNGAGDAMLEGHAMVLKTEALHAGVALHVMLPTGSELEGFGMGHVMVMPSAWVAWRAAPFTVEASGGYGRAMTDLGGHNHGGPLVDPMNPQELTWTAGADIDLGHGMQLGGRTLGGVPLGAGTTRVIGGGRVAWATPRVSTGLEVQVGLAGDPFTVRGVLDTALRF